MSASKEHQPTLDSVAPRFLVGDMEQALAFYGQLGFATPYHDEGFAILERDGIALQFNVSDPTQEPPKEGISWQITPRALTDALAVGGDEARRAFEAMMTMKKINIAAIEAARRS